MSKYLNFYAWFLIWYAQITFCALKGLSKGQWNKEYGQKSLKNSSKARGGVRGEI